MLQKQGTREGRRKPSSSARRRGLPPSEAEDAAAARVAAAEADAEARRSRLMNALPIAEEAVPCTVGTGLAHVVQVGLSLVCKFTDASISQKDERSERSNDSSGATNAPRSERLSIKPAAVACGGAGRPSGGGSRAGRRCERQRSNVKSLDGASSACCGYLDIVRACLSAGADVHVKTSKGRQTPCISPSSWTSGDRTDLIGAAQMSGDGCQWAVPVATLLSGNPRPAAYREGAD